MRSNTILTKLSSMAHYLAVFFGSKSIFEDLFIIFQHFGGPRGSFKGLKGPTWTIKLMNQTTM